MRRARSWLAAACVAASAAACVDDSIEHDARLRSHEGPSTASIDDPIAPLPLTVEFDVKKAQLGEKLYYDPILSPKGDMTCASCHVLEKGGDDGRAQSHFPERPLAVLNTPTVFNVAYNFRLHWGGAFEALSNQLAVPVESPRVFATTFDDIVTRLRSSPAYREAFAAVYPEGITVATFKDALVEFEKTLVTPNARFDRYLRGDESALTEEEKAGYALFKSHGCISCHQGMNIGGNLFQKLGVMREFFEERGAQSDVDLGRYNVTRREEDKHKFRVPSLRNVAVTGPYFHDGSVETLEEAVQVMSEYQLGRRLTEDQVASIVAFLRTLTGEYRGRLLE